MSGDHRNIFIAGDALVLIKEVVQGDRHMAANANVSAGREGYARASAFVVTPPRTPQPLGALLSVHELAQQLPVFIRQTVATEAQVRALSDVEASGLLLELENYDAARLQLLLETARECGLETAVVASDDEGLKTVEHTDAPAIVVAGELRRSATAIAQRVRAHQQPRTLIYALDGATDARLTSLYLWGYRGVICGDHVNA
jgi:indole-3-glycerol phosphate synthase